MAGRQAASATIQIKQLPNETAQTGSSLVSRALRQLRRDKGTLAAMAVIGLMVLLAIFAPVITGVLRVSPDRTNPVERLLPPGTPGHILGTDDLGRDYLARLLYGAQVSFAIGFFGSVITLGIGMVIGVITGYYGGWVDDVVNWVITTLDSIPGIYLLILLTALLRPSAEVLVLLLALTGWTGFTRLIRGQTFKLRQQEYIASAEAIGATSWRIMFVHIMPNLLSLTVLSLAGGIAGLILAESTLSFLGLGVQPPTPTWGNMLTNARLFFKDGPHLGIISGLLIFITVFCLYIIGDGLRDAFDPQTSSLKK
jgi:peptide/nickel transport system permease protein